MLVFKKIEKMNKYEHAENSALLFGGNYTDYLPVHEIIDSNKTVTPSIFGRFFMHHIDVGLPILEKIFGKTIGDRSIPVKNLLAQHLIEDYGRVITYKDDWWPAIKENINMMPQMETELNFAERCNSDPRINKLKTDEFEQIGEYFALQHLMKRDASYLPITAHALGCDLLVRTIGPKLFDKYWTLDILTGYLNCLFKWPDRNHDPVPTLLDWEKGVPDKAWMHAPKDYGSGRVEDVRIKINSYFNNEIKSKTPIPDRNPFPTSRRSPCNLD